jgi:lipid-A-disaccharide synthase
MKALLLAGEESGVLYAERLAEILRDSGAEVRGYGDYGFQTADLAVFGIWEVVRRIFYFLGVARTMKRAIREWRPDVVVTIDYPGMNLKLAAYAKGLGIPAVHIVCPQVWAWHRGRVPKVAAALTELLCFFPFEPEIFKGTDLNAKFIGHPLVGMVKDESIKSVGTDPAKDAGTDPAKVGTDPESTPGLKRKERIVALLPGSRMGEIQRILPRLLKAVTLIAKGQTLNETGGQTLQVGGQTLQVGGQTPETGGQTLKEERGQTLKIVIPAANERAEREIGRILASFEGLPPVEVWRGQARALLRSADCAAVASGTATLEAALVRCPTVLVYAVSPLLAWILRRAITGVRHAGLANIIAEKCGFEPPMPELLQEDFTSEAVARQLTAWLSDPAARAEASARLDGAMAYLQADGDPIQIAAREILVAGKGLEKR